MKTKFLLPLGGLLILVACGGPNPAAQQNAAPVASYPTAVVESTTVELESVYPVTIKGRDDVEVRPRIDGFIEAIYFDEGSIIRKGQSLFKINSPAAEQGLQSARAAVASAEATLATAQLNVERMRPLAEKKIIGEVQLQTYENQFLTAQAALKQAQATLEQAEETRKWTNVHSPVDGVAGAIPNRIGSLVNSANILTTIGNTGSVFAYFSVNEKDLLTLLAAYPGATQAEKIKNMPNVTLRLADGSVYPEKGRIETISGVVNTATGSANLRAEFPNPQGLLRSGTSGRLSLPRYAENAFLVDQKATFAQQDKTLVYVVEADTVRAQMISVEPTPDGKSYAVTSGLSEGTRIVTDGVATLRTGKRIKAD